MLLLVHLSLWCAPCPTHPSAVLTSTAVVSCAVLSLGVWCVWRVCLSVLFVWWGILRLLPLTVVVGGAVVDGGAWCVAVALPSDVGVPLV